MCIPLFHLQIPWKFLSQGNSGTGATIIQTTVLMLVQQMHSLFQKENLRLRMVSEDVIHSYYVPDFRVKKDVVPNRYSMLWFEKRKR